MLAIGTRLTIISTLGLAQWSLLVAQGSLLVACLRFERLPGCFHRLLYILGSAVWHVQVVLSRGRVVAFDVA